MQRIVPCLWFDGDAEDAAAFYVTLLPNSQIDHVLRAPLDTPGSPAGKVLTVEFTMAGNQYIALNGGPQFPFTEAVSLQIHCENQSEVDRLWSALTDGGSEVHCGWLKDRWGLSWQIVPTRLIELLNGSDTDRARRVQEATMKMVKLDITALERAADGT